MWCLAGRIIGRSLRGLVPDVSAQQRRGGLPIQLNRGRRIPSKDIRIVARRRLGDPDADLAVIRLRAGSRWGGRVGAPRAVIVAGGSVDVEVSCCAEDTLGFGEVLVLLLVLLMVLLLVLLLVLLPGTWLPRGVGGRVVFGLGVLVVVVVVVGV